MLIGMQFIVLIDVVIARQFVFTIRCCGQLKFEEKK